MCLLHKNVYFNIKSNMILPCFLYNKSFTEFNFYELNWLNSPDQFFCFLSKQNIDLSALLKLEESDLSKAGSFEESSLQSNQGENEVGKCVSA